MPWARVLDIGLGGDPNFPSVSPTPTQSPTMTGTPSMTGTGTPTSSQTATNMPSSTPTQTPSHTPTTTSTISLNSIPSDTPTQTPTPSQTPSNITPTQTSTTSLSQTPSVTASINLQILPPVQQTPAQIISSTNRVTQLRSVTPSTSPEFEFNSANCLINSEACPNVDANDYEIPLLAPSGAVIIVTETDPNSLIFSDNSDVVSDVFDVSLANPNAILGGDVEICLKAKTKREDLCLGYLDESKSPPKWECEDRCLQIDDNGLICGETDHFTNFALLLDGNGSGSSDCGDDFDGWITNSWVGDFILILSCFAFCIVIGLIIVILGTLVPTFNQFIYGNEGHRIQKSRRASSLV